MGAFPLFFSKFFLYPLSFLSLLCLFRRSHLLPLVLRSSYILLFTGIDKRELRWPRPGPLPIFLTKRARLNCTKFASFVSIYSQENN